jgi:hypothetical protein
LVYVKHVSVLSTLSADWHLLQKNARFRKESGRFLYLNMLCGNLSYVGQSWFAG